MSVSQRARQSAMIASTFPEPGIVTGNPVDNVVKAAELKEPLHHEELYFQGGHVVLALGPRPTLFRVQRAMLVNQSEVFRNMLEAPSLSEDEPKNFEDSSDETTIFLPDDPEEFACVLKVYYQNILTPLPEKPDFDFITGVLRVSSKHHFHRASEWALGTLRADWARTSSVWIAHCSNPTPPPGLAQDALKLIVTSRSTGSTEFLPTAFYFLCVFDNWGNVTPGGPTLTQDDFIILLKGSRCLTRTWGTSRAQRGGINIYGSSQATYEAQWWKEFVGNNTTITTVLKAMGLIEEGEVQKQEQGVQAVQAQVQAQAVYDDWYDDGDDYD